jgi:hypothetical protein
MPRREDNPSPQELRREASHIEHSGRTEEGKNPGNVAGGKKAAATRKEEHRGSGHRGSHER